MEMNQVCGWWSYPLQNISVSSRSRQLWPSFVPPVSIRKRKLEHKSKFADASKATPPQQQQIQPQKSTQLKEQMLTSCVSQSQSTKKNSIVRQWKEQITTSTTCPTNETKIDHQKNTHTRSTTCTTMWTFCSHPSRTHYEGNWKSKCISHSSITSNTFSNNTFSNSRSEGEEAEAAINQQQTQQQQITNNNSNSSNHSTAYHQQHTMPQIENSPPDKTMSRRNTFNTICTFHFNSSRAQQ